MVLNYLKELKSHTSRTAVRTASVVGMSLSVLLTTTLSVPALAANDELKPKTRSVQTTPVGSAAYMPDQIIVMPSKGLDKEDLDKSIKDIDGKIVDKDLMGMAYLVQVPKGTLEKELLKAKKDKNFQAVERNAISHAHASAPSFGSRPNDPGYPLQFYLAQLGVQGAWALGATGQGVVFGLLDTGMDYNTNPDLQGRNTGLLNGFGYQSGRNLPNGAEEDLSFGHGSFVTNCFGASTNNGFGFAGPCFNSTVVPVSIVTGNLNDGANGLSATDFSIARGIQFQELNNVKLVNLSFGTDPPDSISDFGSHILLQQVFANFSSIGGIVFNSAGNSGLPDGNGKKLPGLIVVSAIDPTLMPTSFTVWGPATSFAAPGDSIAQTAYGGQAFVAGGTSFSSPFTAAVAGQVKSLRPDLPMQSIVNIMASTCTHPRNSQDTLQLFYGYGVPNAAAACRLAQTSF